jgi:hypothetical protein
VRTLIRLNELLSQDYYWRRRIDNEIFYVVVDTDIEEIKEFHAAIRSHLKGVKDPPYTTPVKLAEGVTHLKPLINQYFFEPFKSATDTSGRDRLLAHWWNRGPQSLFTAPNVIGVTDGAGQCPPVSYFLTWKSLEGLEGQFKQLIEEVQKRQHGFGNIDVLNFIIVAGLAGGTGRGSWELIAFKLREMFRRYKKTPKPRAFLFDATRRGLPPEAGAEDTHAGQLADRHLTTVLLGRVEEGEPREADEILLLPAPQYEKSRPRQVRRPQGRLVP